MKTQCNGKVFEYDKYDEKELQQRKLQATANMIKQANKIIVVTGAGISVSSGIPDFRGEGGVFQEIIKKFPNVTDAKQLFQLDYFKMDPQPFFYFMKDLLSKKPLPSATHKFVKHLEDSKKLLRNYTQNVDSLESSAGIKNVVQCHGTIDTATCIACGFKTKQYAVKPAIVQGLIPYCPECLNNGEQSFLKPDVILFGEDLPENYRKSLEHDKLLCDLLIVIGSSLSVNPVASIPKFLRRDVPKVLINKVPNKTETFEVELIGDSDQIVHSLSNLLRQN